MDSNKKILAYGFLAIVSFQYAFINTEWEIGGFLQTLFTGLAVAIFLIWMILQKYKIKFFAVMSVFLLIAALTYVATGETVFLVMLMAAMMFTSVDYKKAFKFLLNIRVILLLVVVIASLAGILDTNATSIVKGGTSSAVVGYGLGYDHPNQLGCTVCVLFLLYVCYKNEKIKYRNIVLIGVIAIVTYIITKNRTGALVSALLIISLLFYKNKVTSRYVISLLEKTGRWIMPACAVLALGLPLLMDSVLGQAKVILYAINGILGSRFTHSARVFENYSVPSFGGIIDFEKLQIIYQYSTVDNGYLRLLYNFGIVGFAIFMILYFLTIKEMIQKKEYIYVIAIALISSMGILENVLRSFALNFTVAFWCELLTSNYALKAIKRKRKLVFKM